MTSRLRIRVLDDRYPLAYRERAATRLADLVDKYPDSPFARSLRAQADSAYEESPSLEKAMERLEETAARTGTVPAGKRREHHLDLCDQVRRLDNLYDLRVSKQVRCRVLPDVAAHSECVRDLIGAATRQIVFVTPIVDYQELHSLADALRKRLVKGVRLVLVWGTRSGEELDPRVQELLADLSEEFPERVVWSTRPSRTNACLVIADDRIAVVSGRPPLRAVRAADKGEQPGGRELGLRVAAASAGPCPAMEALLEWARKSIPDYLVSTMLQIRHSDFLDTPSTVSARPLDLPDDPTESDVEFWHEAWTRYARFIRRKVSDTTRPWAEVIYGEAHRHELSDALRSARSRILISSRRVGFEMGGARLPDALRAPLLRGAAVTVLHGDDHAAMAATSDVLRSLCAQFPDRLLTEHRNTNARVLVFDDVVVAGSFDPLSGGSGAPHRRRSDIGIRIAGGTVADRVMAALRIDAAVVSPDLEESPLSESVDTAVSAQAMFAALREAPSGDEPARAAVIRAHIDDAGQAMAWALLDDLERKDVDAGILRVAAAHVLRSTPEGGRSGHFGRWWRWLMLERWHAAAFVEAAVLRETIADPDVRPRRLLTAVAAARGHAPFPDAIVEAVLSDPTEAEKAALAAVGVAEVLLAAHDEHAETADQALDLLSGELGEPWRAMAGIARGHWAANHRPLPLARILAESDAEHRRADLAGGWRDLDLRLQRVERTTFRFGSSIKTHARLFFDDGPFGLLRPVIDRRSVPGLRSWLRTQPVDDVRALVREIGAEVQQQGELMHDYQRIPPYLKRLEALVQAARALTTAVREPAGDGGYEVEAARELARTLAARWPTLTGALATVPDPERQLAARALADLDVVSEWGAS